MHIRNIGFRRLNIEPLGVSQLTMPRAHVAAFLEKSVAVEFRSFSQWLTGVGEIALGRPEYRDLLTQAAGGVPQLSTRGVGAGLILSALEHSAPSVRTEFIRQVGLRGTSPSREVSLKAKGAPSLSLKMTPAFAARYCDAVATLARLGSGVPPPLPTPVLRENMPVIAVGGGKISLPGADIGAGHATPARAIIEGLSRHPDVRAGKVVVQPVLPDNGKVEKPLTYLEHRDLTVSTGFSGLSEDRYSMPHVRSLYDETILNAAPTGQFVQFLADTQPKVTADMAPGLLRRAINDPELAWRAFKRYVDPSTIRFGDGANVVPPFASYSDISPALTEVALRSIGSVFEGELSSAVVYEAFAEHLKSIGNRAGAAYVLKGIQAARRDGREYKPILVTGSSRGDYVAPKTLDTLEALNGAGLRGFSVVPLLGKNEGVTGRLLAKTGIPPIGGAPQSLYAQLRGTAVLNIGSSGASDLNELKALPAPSLIPRNQRQLRDRELAELTGLSEEELTKLRSVDTEAWNAGGMQDIERVAPFGIALYSSSTDIASALQNPVFMDKGRNAHRARLYFEAAKANKTDLANRLVAAAYRAKKE